MRFTHKFQKSLKQAISNFIAKSLGCLGKQSSINISQQKIYFKGIKQMQNQHTLQKQRAFWSWFPKVSELQGISQSLIRIYYPSTWHFSEMSIPAQSCSFVQNRFIDILLLCLSIPPVARFCFITHQKGLMLRAPHAQLRAGGLNSCK